MLKITKKDFTIELINTIDNQFYSYCPNKDYWIPINRKLFYRLIKISKRIESISSLPKHFEYDTFGSIVNVS